MPDTRCASFNCVIFKNCWIVVIIPARILKPPTIITKYPWYATGTRSCAKLAVPVKVEMTITGIV